MLRKLLSKNQKNDVFKLETKGNDIKIITTTTSDKIEDDNNGAGC